MRNILLGAAALAVFSGCRGTSPAMNAAPYLGAAAVLVRGRILLPTGETRSGRLELNLESDGERYRIRFLPQETTLYVIEPGSYQARPIRDIFGRERSQLQVVADGRSRRVPFPWHILHLGHVAVKPAQVVALGVLEARFAAPPGGSEPELTVRLDNSVETRRLLVQDMIARMMDPDAPAPLRENAVAWTRALDQALVQLQGSREATQPSE